MQDQFQTPNNQPTDQTPDRYTDTFRIEPPVYQQPVQPRPAQPPVYQQPVQPRPAQPPVYQQPVQPRPAQPPVYQQPVYQPQPPQSAPQPKTKKELPAGVRILLRALTVILCVLLTVSLTVTLVVLDINMLVSKKTIKSAAEELLYVPMTQPRLSQNPGSTEDLVVELIYDAIYGRDDNDLTVTKDEIAEFVDDGSVSDFLTDKAASYLEDIIRGTRNTEIDEDEVEDLLDDNRELIEEVFDITLDKQTREDILNYIRENDLNEIVQEQILDEVEKIPVTEDVTVGDLLDFVRFWLSPLGVILLIVVDILLAVAIFFTKRMRWGGAALTVGSQVFGVGLTGSVPLLVLSLIPDLLRSIGLDRGLIRVVEVLVGAVVPVHLTFVILGAVMMAVGIVLKIVLKPKAQIA